MTIVELEVIWIALSDVVEDVSLIVAERLELEVEFTLAKYITPEDEPGMYPLEKATVG